MKNLPLLLGTIIGTLVLIVVVALFSSGGAQTTEQGQLIVDQAQVMGDARHVFGPASQNSVTDQQQIDQNESNSAPEATTNSQNATESADTQETQELVTIVEFSDFQCPACKASLPAVKQVLALYPDKVQLIYRHFPLDSIHPNARLAAIASEAVASFDPAKFWPFHDKLFTEQKTWANISDRGELKDTFATYAVELGLDRTQFLEKMEDNSLAELVNSDVTSGTQLGVNATPSFYVNGIKTSAPQLQATVETLLSN